MMREIVFFDVETTAPSDRRWWLLEFGAILVCPKKLVEVGSYDTLIRPGDPSAVSKRFTNDVVESIRSAPPFEDVADKIFDILDGRVWAGHNIQRFDCPRIREAFADIGRPAPEPVGVIDSLNVLTHEFGRRAGDLKMATLASYFGIGKQKHRYIHTVHLKSACLDHACLLISRACLLISRAYIYIYACRSLDDARMNLEVLKHCATVLLLVNPSQNKHLASLISDCCLILIRSSKAQWDLSVYMYVWACRSLAFLMCCAVKLLLMPAAL